MSDPNTIASRRGFMSPFRSIIIVLPLALMISLAEVNWKAGMGSEVL